MAADCVDREGVLVRTIDGMREGIIVGNIVGAVVVMTGEEGIF